MHNSRVLRSILHLTIYCFGAIYHLSGTAAVSWDGTSPPRKKNGCGGEITNQ